MRLAFLSAGAAQGVVSALAAEIGCEISGSFGAVGAIREKVLAGEPADLVILTVCVHTTSLEFDDCPGFEALRAEAEPEEVLGRVACG